MRLAAGPMVAEERTMEGLLSPVWAAAVTMALIPALLASEAERKMLTLLAAALVCVLTQMLLPRARFRTEHYFSPVNVALLLLHMKILLVPVLLMVVGYENKIGALPASVRSMEGALLVDIVAYVAFCAGLQWFGGREPDAGRFSLLPALSETPGLGYVAVFAAVGLLGLFLTFGSVGRLMEYFSDPASILGADEEASVGGFLGTVLRPFLAFALATWWARSADQSLATGIRWRPMAVGIVAAAGIAVANLTFGFNRGAVVFPLLSLVAVYSLRVQRIPPVLTFAAIGCCVPLLLAAGTFRGNSQMAKAGPGMTKDVEFSMAELAENIVVYCGGPQLTAVFYESLDWGEKLYGGQTLVASVMSPIPILGKGFRENGGPMVYNRAIYGTSGIDDQIPPFAAELFGNFHVAGVVAGFALLSLLLANAEAWLRAVESTFGAFVIQYVAVWGAMLTVWSVSVYVQILFYFLGPVYLYLAVGQLRALFRRMPEREMQGIGNR
jgi:hypothetical protein